MQPAPATLMYVRARTLNVSLMTEKMQNANNNLFGQNKKSVLFYLSFIFIICILVSVFFYALKFDSTFSNKFF